MIMRRKNQNHQECQLRQSGQTKLPVRAPRFTWDCYAHYRLRLFAQIDRPGEQPTMGIMHFGCPTWLPQAVGDPEFPEALERFTDAFVTRYKEVIHTWCPFNEPLVTSLFSGDFGFWPPHSRQWRGYFPVLSRIALAVNRAIRAVRRADPGASVLLSDAADHFQT